MATLKIATHDSATGERPLWWCSLLTPFARTQSKTLYEQYRNGCRVFDIRVKRVGKTWRCAHGWWFTKRTFDDIMEELDLYARTDEIVVYLTYEGKTENAEAFEKYVKNYVKKRYTHIRYGVVCAKYGKESKGLKVEFEKLINGDVWIISKRAFLPLDGTTWHTYIPIPWLWKQFYFKKVCFNEDFYLFVDFL